MIKRAVIFILIFLIPIFLIIPAWTQHEEQFDLISLDLKGMDISDVLKILAQKSGLNIVADKDVKGTVSLYVKDVSVISALDILVFTNGLAYEEEGALIRVMTDKEYEKLHGQAFRDKTKTEIIRLNYANASNIAQVLSGIKTKIGKIIADDASGTIVLIDNAENIKRMKDAVSEMDTPLVTEIFSLDYAKAETTKDKVEKMLSQNIGSIKFDERTNKIIVKDTPKKIEEIKKVLGAFDEKTREVLIDANIVQVTLSDKYSYGIDWSAVAKLPDVKLTMDTNLTTKLSNTTPNTLTIGTSEEHKTVMSFLDTFGKTNVLSRPRITVANREEAKIMVGSKEVYVTSEVTTTSGGTYNTADHVQFVDVGVTLGVTPEINKEGYIKMKIKPGVSSTDTTKTVTLTNPDGSTRTVVPYVTTSEAETTVLVKDGTTLILGGLMKDNITEYNDKVPFLGDVPILGRLFSTKGKGKEKTELVIFLTPHIIDGGNTTEEAQRYKADWENKPEEINIKEPKENSQPKAKVKKQKTNLEKDQPRLKMKAEKRAQPRQKWAPILGAADRKVKKTETPEVKTAAQPLPAKKTPYEEYYLALRQEINNLAKQDADISGIKGEVQLQFTLDKEGFLIKGPIVLNNPDLRLVRSVVKIIKKASPFLRFPKALKQEQADFSVVIKYE